MKYETGLRLYDLGWIVGIIVFFLMRIIRDNGYPEEIAFIVAFVALGVARWMVEKMTAPKQKPEVKKDNNQPKKENPANDRKRY